jgi:tetratricopeptide (TPR) repeat protein
MKKKNSKDQKVVFKKKPISLRLFNAVYPYRKAVIASVFLLLIAGLLIGGWFSYRDWRSKKAMELLRTAKDGNDYQNIVNHYSRTSASAVAMIRLGELKWRENKYDQAREIYERFIRVYPESVLAPFVKNLIGECFLQEKKFAESESVFNSLLSDSVNNFIHSTVQMNLARLIAARGDVQKAVEHFKKLKQEKGNMLWMDTIDGFLRSHEQSVQN